MAQLQLFMGIMLFYAIISCLLGPLLGYYIGGRSIESAGTGFICGSLASIILWLSVGQKMALR